MKRIFAPNYVKTNTYYGQLINPAQANLATLGITIDANQLGRAWGATGRNGEDFRLLLIVKNSSGGTLSAKKLVKFATTADAFNKEISAVTAADADPVAGAVEEGYASGVPNGYYFRMVVWCPRFPALLANQNSARIALNPGDRIVANSNGEFWGFLGAAVSDAATALALAKQIQNNVGHALVASTNVAGDRGATRNIHLDLI